MENFEQNRTVNSGVKMTPDEARTAANNMNKREFKFFSSYVRWLIQKDSIELQNQKSE